MAFPDDPLNVTIEAAFGADRTADPSTWSWTDLTDRWHDPDVLSIFTGRRDNSRQAEAGHIALTFKNPDGQLTPENPGSQWWPHVDEGLPIRATLDPQLPGGETLVFGGFASSITPRWPGGSAGQALVDVVAGGLIRQYARGRSPLRDTVYRYLTRNADDLLNYWALDDTEAAGRGASGLGLQPMVALDVFGSNTLTRPKWRDGRLYPWLDPVLATFHDGDGGVLTGEVAGPAGGFAFGFLMRADLPRPDSGDEPMVHAVDVLDQLGQAFRFRWQTDTDEIILAYSDPDPGEDLFFTTISGGPANLLADGDTHHVLVTFFHAGSRNVAWELWIDGSIETAGTTNVPGLATAAIPPPAQSRISWSGAAPQVLPIRIGHLGVWSGPGPAMNALIDATLGHPGEPAIARGQRLCDEEGVPVTIVGTAADSEAMGPQHPGTFLELLRECERTDDGILAEQAFSFWLRTRISRYNQDPALVVDASQRQLGRQFEPTRDDQRTRNEWTVTQTLTGAQVTVLDAADQQRRGVKDQTLEVNVGSVQRLADRAHWELDRSTLRALRYPTLTVHLHSSPALVEQVMATELGDRVQVQNPPRQHPPGPVDQVVEGIRHTIRGRRAWTWEAVVAPYAPWQVGVYAADAETPGPAEPKRYGPTDSRVADAFTVGTDTSLSVEDQTGGNDLWSQTADFPLDILVRGVRLRCTAVGAPAGAVQTLTVDQVPINGPGGGLDGIVIAAGEQVELWAPARYAL